MKIFLINNNIRYANNYILQEFFEHGDLLVYLNIYSPQSSKYIFEGYHLLSLQKQLSAKILYFHNELEFTTFLKHLNTNIEIYGEIFFIHWIQEFLTKNNVHDISINFNITKSNILLQSYIKHYKVYTPFKNAHINDIKPFNIIENYNIKNLKSNQYHQYFCENQLENLPEYNFKDFPIGEQAAYDRWNSFKLIIQDYQEGRSAPYVKHTSRLSAYINAGVVSVEILWNDSLQLPMEHALLFRQQMMWRDFSHHTYHYIPSMIFNSIYDKFEKVPWKYESPEFEHWKRGQTGFLMIDAAMIELNTTGYMFNRCRMLTASLLIKNLKIYWLMGANYFMEKLVDFDYILNSFNWQWVNGSGMDAAPYFRIFNPHLQLEKFDKNLQYVKQYIPNLEEHMIKHQEIVDFSTTRSEILELYKEFIVK